MRPKPRTRRARRAIGALFVACLAAGCVPTHEKLRAEIDELTMPPGYELVEATSEGTYPPFFGSTLRVWRRYRSPHELERTCQDLRRIPGDFATDEPAYRPIEKRGFASRCAIGFRRGRYPVALLAIGPPDPDAIRELGAEPWTYVTVDVQISAP